MKKFFSQLFSDNNHINEKSIIGFVAFLMMIITLIIDLTTGIMGKDIPIHEFVYDGFLILALGSLGISSVDKFVNKDKIKKDTESEEEELG